MTAPRIDRGPDYFPPDDPIARPGPAMRAPPAPPAPLPKLPAAARVVVWLLPLALVAMIVASLASVRRALRDARTLEDVAAARVREADAHVRAADAERRYWQGAYDRLAAEGRAP